MRIQRIKLRLVNVPERTNWWSDEVFGQPAHQRKDRFIVEVYTDTGLKGWPNLIMDFQCFNISGAIKLAWRKHFRL